MNFNKKYNAFIAQQELLELDFLNEEYTIMRLALSGNANDMLDNIITQSGVNKFEDLELPAKLRILNLMDKSI